MAPVRPVSPLGNHGSDERGAAQISLEKNHTPSALPTKKSYSSSVLELWRTKDATPARPPRQRRDLSIIRQTPGLPPYKTTHSMATYDQNHATCNHQALPCDGHLPTWDPKHRCGTRREDCVDRTHHSRLSCAMPHTLLNTQINCVIVTKNGASDGGSQSSRIFLKLVADPKSC